MTERTYRFDLVCPRCGKLSETVGDRKAPPPRLNCGDCLINDVEIVELKVVAVEVRYA